jgi:hypothetical protein
MRFCGGLTVEETAVMRKISPVTVRRDWSAAGALTESAVGSGCCRNPDDSVGDLSPWL